MTAKRLGGIRGKAAAMLLVGLVASGLWIGGVSAERSDAPKGGPFADGAEQTTKGNILFGTPENARSFSTSNANGVFHWILEVTPDAPFLLEAQQRGTRVCVLGGCSELGDFDVVFLHQFDDGRTQVVSRQYNVGEESGTVPNTADLGLVYLRTPGLVPGLSGYGFVYYEGLAGHDKLPDAAGRS